MNYITFNSNRIAPSKVICIGRNYAEHIHELNNEIPSSMVVFNKPNSAITDTLYFVSEDTRFEGEICFLMIDGKIAGIGFGLDLTKANLQNFLKSKGLPWERAKGFDNSAVLGRFVPFSGDITKISFEMFVNDTLVQYANYDLMIYKPLEMIEEIKSFMSIEDGDVIMSGTPKGVATYNVGDRFLANVYCDGEMICRFEVVAEESFYSTS